MNFAQNLKAVQALEPATDAAGRTGDYVSLKTAHKVAVVVHITQGNAATIQISFSQATDVGGTGAKALAKTVPIWSNLDCAASDTLVRRAAAVNYTTDAGVKHKIVIFEIEASKLDLDNGFDCIAVVTGASNVANLTAAMYYLVPHRYQQATPPSAIID